MVRLKHEGVHDGGWMDLALESDGTIRLLGLLTGLNHVRSLPLIGIEEPELTVHPGALTALSDVLKEATRRSQLVLTTHSPELIDRITGFRDVDPMRIVELVDRCNTGQPSVGCAEGIRRAPSFLSRRAASDGRTRTVQCEHVNRPPNIIAIVEGDGDVAAVPDLLRRILWERLFRYDIQAPKPKQAHGKPNLLKKFEKFLHYAIIDNCDAILVICGRR